MQNEFRRMVRQSSLDKRTQKQLWHLNAWKAWYHPVTNQHYHLIGKKRIDVETFRLARCIICNIRRRWDMPDLSRVRTMNMDGKIAVVKQAEAAHSADYWVRVSTLIKGKPVLIPLKSQAAFRDRLARDGAQLANHCDVIIKADGSVAFRLIVKTPIAAQVQEGDSAQEDNSTALDWGLTTLFSADDGSQYGRGFLDRLKAYDARLQPLIADLNRNHIPLKQSKRYLALIEDIRGFTTNEVNRCLNRMLNPEKGGRAYATVVVEKLDFRYLARQHKLSKSLRRILNCAGRAAVSQKLAALSEDHGFEHIEVNPAYSSQECSGCGFVCKANRKSQAVFECRHCGKKIHADVNSARVLLGRSKDSALEYKSVTQVLSILDKRLSARWGIQDPAKYRERKTKRHESRLT